MAILTMRNDNVLRPVEYLYC